MANLDNRYDFVFLFDVVDGNPNGDPETGNKPRVDGETGQGLVTDVCLKRKIRNYVASAKQDDPNYDIFIQEGVVLDNRVEETYKTDAVKKADKKTQKDAANKALCDRYYDVRTFGAVIATKEKQGQIKGPVQLTFGRSIDQIVTQDIAITRIAVTKESAQEKGKTMGRKATVPYGLYRTFGFVNANLANQTGFSTEDLDVLWQALINMFDLDRSAAKGLMSPRKLIVFKHNSKLGNAPANLLFDRVIVTRKPDVTIPRSFYDYVVTIDRDNTPKGIEIIEII